MSLQQCKTNNKQSNSREQSTIQEDYSTQKSYLQDFAKSLKLNQSKIISKNKKVKKINDEEITRMIKQSEVVKQYLDQEEDLFEQKEQYFYQCDYCGNEYQGRYDVDRHQKSVHPEEYCQDNPDFFQCKICFQAFHKSNCTKHVKSCGNNHRERLRQKKQNCENFNNQKNKLLGNLQQYQQYLDNQKEIIKIQEEISLYNQMNESQQLTQQQSQIQMLRKQLEETKLKANNNNSINQSFLTNFADLTNDTTYQNQNFTLLNQPPKASQSLIYPLPLKETKINPLLSSSTNEMEVEETNLQKSNIF